MPPDAGPPPHTHNAEDETFILLESRIIFRVGDAVHDARPGTVIFVPRGTPHGFRNGVGGIARMLFMYAPAGMDGMFAEIGAPGERHRQAPPLDAADIAAMTRVADKYRFSIVAG